jgi:probable F420-dependent oxidoreductase
MRVETTMLSPETDQYAGRGQKGLAIDAIAAAAREVEEMGFDVATVPEAGHDPYLPLAIIAEHTRNITLATNVAISFPRSPLVTAQLAWDLQQLSGGRFQLGLGTQVKGHNERRYATPWPGPPGPRMREYILCLEAMFESFENPRKRSTFKGEHYQFTLMPPFFNPGPIEHPRPPVYIAAVNTYMAGLAGELCDGIRVHPISTFSHNREVLIPNVEKGAGKAGRTLSDVDIVGSPFLAVSRDEDGLEAAKAAVKQSIAFYASTRTYHAVLDFHGWTEVGQELHRFSLEGKWTEMPKLISDEMLEEFAIVAVGDDLGPKLKERCRGIFDSVLLTGAPALAADEEWLRRTISVLQQP